MSAVLDEAKRRQRLHLMRTISARAIEVFGERGFDAVTVETVARETGVSPATLYRRFGTKENLVVWQPDEQDLLATLIERIRGGQSIADAAIEIAREIPDESLSAVESTGRVRLELIAAHPSLRAAARTKSESFVTVAMEAYAGDATRTPLQREVEIRCVAAALDAATSAYIGGQGTLRGCLLEALSVLRGGEGR